MLAEGRALISAVVTPKAQLWRDKLTLSHPASSRASRDYAGTRRERELGCGYAALGIEHE